MTKLFTLALLIASTALAVGPTTKPSTQPAADPDLGLASAPRDARSLNPAQTRNPRRPRPLSPPSMIPDMRLGTLTLSNGEKIRGRLSHTAEKPVRVWMEAEKEYRDVPFKLIASFEAKVTSEYDEKEWHFKESGSDIKEFTGKSYPCRETSYTLTLVNGQTLTGGIVEPIYLQGRMSSTRSRCSSGTRGRWGRR